jgi:hypothetical protein
LSQAIEWIACDRFPNDAMNKVATSKTSRIDLEDITMLPQPTSTLPLADVDFAMLLEEPFEAIAEPDGVLDEAAWLALLIKIDQEEGRP